MITQPPQVTRHALRPQAGRQAWIILGSIFAVITLAYGTLSVIQLFAFARATEQYTFTDVVRAVDIHNETGSTTVIGAEGDEVVVDAKIVHGFRRPDIDAQVVDGVLTVRATCSSWLDTWCIADLTVRVPRDVSLRADADGGGLRVEGIEGDVEVSSSGGGVRLVDVGGDIRARASGGGVRGEQLRSRVADVSSSGGGVRLSFVDPPDAVDARSSGGGVTIEVPSPYAFVIDASSSGGGVDTSEVVHDPNADRTIRVRSSGGGVTVRY
jgi:hypothetical protein